MKVANYTVNFDSFSSYTNSYALKTAPGQIAKRKLARMIREARRDYLDGFGIDWSQYGEPEASFQDMLTCQLEWTHNTSGQKIVLTGIYWDDRTGAITQAGTQYGDLTL